MGRRRLHPRLLTLSLAACGFEGQNEAGDDTPSSDAADASSDAPVVSAKSCAALRSEQPATPDGAYSIDPDGPEGSGPPFTTFCDMTVDNGGWTLVGKIDGRHMIQDKWLVSAVDEPALATPTIGMNRYACVDAVELAVGHSMEVRLSNSTRTQWVKWPLPAGRTTQTWWRHAAGAEPIGEAPRTEVIVATSNGSVQTCYQNVYGILPDVPHGGSYPAASFNTSFGTVAPDACMAVGVTTMTDPDGFDQNGNGYDAPSVENVWPNSAVNLPAHVAVWLR